MAWTLHDSVKFARLLSVEPLGFLTLFIFIFKKNAIDQMIQDKICIQRYALPPGYCYHLPQMKDEEDNFRMKSTILGDVTSFQMYINLCLSVPIFAISLLIGPFIDKYGPAKRMLFIYSAIIFLLESISYLASSFFFNLDYRLLILSSFITALSAGPMIGMTCSWAYLSAVTPGHLRSMRLMIMEVAISTAPPLAIALGGNLLDLRPLFPLHEPRNYCAIFLISIACCLLYLALAYFMVNESSDKRLFQQHFPKQSHHRQSMIPCKDDVVLENSEKVDLGENQPSKSPIAILFDLQNVRQMIGTFVKPRPHQIRTQIVLLFASKVICQFASYGPAIFLYQYVQRVFSWNVSQYSNYVTISQVINIVSTFTVGPVIINVLKITDLNYALIGASMLLGQNFLRLLSTSLWTFYAALPFYLVNSLSTVGIQAYITKVTERSEVGRIFSLMGVLDSLIPLFASLIFATMFKATIDTAPNLSFLPVVLGMGFGIALNGYVSFQSRQTLESIEQDRAKMEKDGEVKGLNLDKGQDDRQDDDDNEVIEHM